jgi:hypothetical protein
MMKLNEGDPYTLLMAVSDRFKLGLDAQLVLITGHLAILFETDNKKLFDATLQYCNKSGLKIDFILKLLCLCIEREELNNKANLAAGTTTAKLKPFSDYIQEIAHAFEVQELAEQRAKEAEAKKPEEVQFPTGTVVQGQVVRAYIPWDWSEQARALLGANAPIKKSRLGEVMLRQVFPCLTAKQEVFIDIVNSRPRPVVDSYMMADGRTVLALPPRYSIDEPFVFERDGYKYEILPAKREENYVDASKEESVSGLQLQA